MTITTSPWPKQSFLDALRPGPGERVQLALLSTYSADLGAVAAALLALAGRDWDDGRGSPAGLAEALEVLKKKVRLLVQCGRLALPTRRTSIVGVFDQFVVDIPRDEAVGSWHPKIALVCYEDDDGNRSWRLWLGSKNLTKAFHYNFGLVLPGSAHTKGGKNVPGVSELAYQLARLAALPNVDPTALATELAGITWSMPSKVRVNWVHLKLGPDTGVALPSPHQADKVIVVSPFADGTFVQKLGTWGGQHCRRSLISTASTLRKLACQAGQPLTGFNEVLGTLDRPEDEGSAPMPAASMTPSTEPGTTNEEEFIPQGLHAKLIAIAFRKSVKILVGSANATQRGWEGGNAEVIAEIEGDTALLEGVQELVSRACPQTLSGLQADGFPVDDLIAKQLEECRRVLATRVGMDLARDGGTFKLRADSYPVLPHPTVELQVGLATTDLVPWPLGSDVVCLGTVPVAQYTTLVRLRLSLDGLACEWLQRLKVVPPLPMERDRAAIAAHLSPAQLIAWLRATLRGDAPSGEVDGRSWDDPTESDDSPARATYPVSRRSLLERITLEEILSCWARDRTAFGVANERISGYLQAVLATAKPTEEERQHLEQLCRVWELARATLGGTDGR